MSHYSPSKVEKAVYDRLYEQGKSKIIQKNASVKPEEELVNPETGQPFFSPVINPMPEDYTPPTGDVANRLHQEAETRAQERTIAITQISKQAREEASAPKISKRSLQLSISRLLKAARQSFDLVSLQHEDSRAMSHGGALELFAQLGYVRIGVQEDEHLVREEVLPSLSKGSLRITWGPLRDLLIAMNLHAFRHHPAYHHLIGEGVHLDDLVAKLGQLEHNRLSYCQREGELGHLPAERRRRLERAGAHFEDEELTFQPALNPHSRRLAETTSTSVRDAEMEEARRLGELPDYQVSPDSSRVGLLLTRHRTAKLRRRRKQEESVRQEMEGCTFKPAITRKGENSRVDSSRHERLYRLSKEPRAHRPTTEEVAVSQCTFRPQTGNTSSAGAGLGGTGTLGTSGSSPSTRRSFVRDYDKSVTRMRIAHRQRMAKKEEFENLGRVKPSNPSAAPPRLATARRSQTRSQPLLFIDVNVGGGKTGRIGVYPGDRPQTLATNFGAVWGLDSELVHTLEGIVAEHMRKYLGWKEEDTDESSGHTDVEGSQLEDEKEGDGDDGEVLRPEEL
eukprot:gnl/Dysnectes_brevis/978_a1090_989.p1 GENE.gnl/Dysnectes_brevis/978_a1090_989~~gnl/Dysnectes_brevis/978_a1090_989.p1  ORF type:complete len:620 (-),score=195.49 gnl/Dysnectes_brevis/978_a1090_989:1222-2913(-)